VKNRIHGEGCACTFLRAWSRPARPAVTHRHASARTGARHDVKGLVSGSSCPPSKDGDCGLGGRTERNQQVHLVARTAAAKWLRPTRGKKAAHGRGQKRGTNMLPGDRARTEVQRDCVGGLTWGAVLARAVLR